VAISTSDCVAVYPVPASYRPDHINRYLGITPPALH
jgi:hypothetical protein